MVIRKIEDFTALLQARFSYVEHRPLTTRHLEGAILSRRLYDEANGFTGAVYDRFGLLQEDTLRFNTADIEPRDPARVDPRDYWATERLPTAVYGGILHPVLGHALFETLPRFWPQAISGPIAPDLPVVFHHWPGLDVEAMFEWPLLRTCFETFGVTQRNLRLITNDDLVVDHLLIPSPAAIYHGFVHPIISRMIDLCRAGCGNEGPSVGARVFLSRSRWRQNRRCGDHDRLDDLFMSLGYAVVHPQNLSPGELMGVLRKADVVAAVDGSHAHLVAFCRPGTRIITLDTRYVPTQVAIETLRQLDALHIPLVEMPDVFDPASMEIVDYGTLRALVASVDRVQGRTDA